MVDGWGGGGALRDEVKTVACLSPVRNKTGERDRLFSAALLGSGPRGEGFVREL